MKRYRTLFLSLIFVISGFSSMFAQGKPRMVIVPVEAASVRNGDEVTAALYSNQSKISGAYSLVPQKTFGDEWEKTKPSNDEDYDGLISLAENLGADFMLWGKLGKTLKTENVFILQIIDVKTGHIIAGAYRPYRDINEIKRVLPAMADELIKMADKKPELSDTFAIKQVRIPAAEESAEGRDIFRHILLIEMLKTNRFSMFPGPDNNADREVSVELRTSDNDKWFVASVIRKDEETSYLTKVFFGDMSLKVGIAQMTDIANNVSGRADEERIAAERYRNSPEGRAAAAKAEAEARAASAKAEATARTAVNKAEREQKAKEWREKNLGDDRKLWSIGASAGIKPTQTPSFLADVHGTIPLTPYTFLEIGTEISTHASDIKDVTYFSFFPYAHYNAVFFLYDWPIYAGIGAGYMMSTYIFTALDNEIGHANLPVLDIPMGLKIGTKHMFDFSYTIQIRVDGTTIVNHKLMLGYTYRFRNE